MIATAEAKAAEEKPQEQVCHTCPLCTGRTGKQVFLKLGKRRQSDDLYICPTRDCQFSRAVPVKLVIDQRQHPCPQCSRPDSPVYMVPCPDPRFGMETQFQKRVACPNAIAFSQGKGKVRCKQWKQVHLRPQPRS
jgi:hypothetical protein